MQENVNNTPKALGKVENTNIPPQEKKKRFSKNKLLIIAFIILGLFALLLIIALALGSGQDTESEAGEEATITPEADEMVYEGLPEENTLYFGTYDGEEVVFIRNILGINYLSQDPYFGYTYYSTGSAKINSFQKIDEPKVILKFDEPVNSDLFKLNKNKNKLYININKRANRDENYPNIDDILFSVDLNTLENKIIWKNAVGSDKYRGAYGTAYVSDVISDEHVVMDILACFGCEPSLAGNIVLNVNTAEEAFIENGKVVDADPANGIFSYQKLDFVTEECPDDPRINCSEDGTYEVKKPIGEVFTDNLP